MKHSRKINRESAVNDPETTREYGREKQSNGRKSNDGRTRYCKVHAPCESRVSDCCGMMARAHGTAQRGGVRDGEDRVGEK